MWGWVSWPMLTSQAHQTSPGPSPRAARSDLANGARRREQKLCPAGVRLPACGQRPLSGRWGKGEVASRSSLITCTLQRWSPPLPVRFFTIPYRAAVAPTGEVYHIGHIRWRLGRSGRAGPSRDAALVQAVIRVALVAARASRRRLKPTGVLGLRPIGQLV